MLKNTRHFEDLNALPSDICNHVFKSFKDEVINKNKYRKWMRSRHLNHLIGDYDPYEIASRMINHNIGKPFSQVFSKFCKTCKIYQQKVFLNEFKGQYSYHRNKFYYNYYIDDDGLIQPNIKPKEKKPVVFYSRDYRAEERHIITGKPKPNFWYFDKNKHKADLYKVVEVSGFSIVFDSKSNTKFKRLNAEKINAINREHKKRKKHPSISEKEFRRILKEREQKEREENLIKIISHGFDPVTSFRKRKKENINA